MLAGQGAITVTAHHSAFLEPSFSQGINKSDVFIVLECLVM